MIQFIEMDAGHVVGIRIQEKIKNQEFDAITALLEKRMEKYPKVNVYIELDSLKGIKPKAFLKDLKFGLQNLNRIDREAIVTEKNWVQNLSSAAGTLVPGVDIKAFSFDEKDIAKQWVQAS